jgi:hypothetical protein
VPGEERLEVERLALPRGRATRVEALEELGRLERGTDLPVESGPRLADHLMHHAGRYVERVARRMAFLHAVDDRRDRAFEDLEALLLRWMEVRGRQGGTFAVGRLHLEQLPVGLGGRADEPQIVA